MPQLKKIKIENFRNLKNINLEFIDKTNIFFGDNAQGKTNLLEAIWLFSGAKSFRGARDSELINFDADFAKAEIEFFAGEREQTASFVISQKKSVKLNDVPQKSFCSLYGNFLCVVFSPVHLSLIKDGPEKRRRFLDNAISVLKPSYNGYLSQYEKILSQRNCLLKDIYKYPQLKDTIDVWDLQLAKIGTIITIFRNDYINKLNIPAKEIYSGFSKKNEEIQIGYISTVYDDLKKVREYNDTNIEIYYQKLKQALCDDIQKGQTSVGIHRDDIEINIDGNSARMFGSQGQQRSCVLALKLAEAKLIKNITGESPIILLDDVLSELDEKRQDFVLNHIKEQQTFITCCDKARFENDGHHKIFNIKNGNII